MRSMRAPAAMRMEATTATEKNKTGRRFLLGFGSTVAIKNLTDGMTDVLVTADAGEVISGMRDGGADILDDLLMTLHASVFGDSAVAWFDAQRIGELAGGEGERVPEAIVGFGDVFADDVVGCVAVVACGNGAVAGLEPAIIMLLHDVAVCAGVGIVGEIGSALGIDESIAANPAREAYHAPQDQPFDHARSHPPAVDFRLSEETAQPIGGFSAEKGLRRRVVLVGRAPGVHAINAEPG